MAKSLLLTVLVEVLGKYVDGLTQENLKLGVWSGKIKLNNLKLRESALDELNLPVKVLKGSLKSLTVKVPWTQLDSKPVEIYLDGIYLLASPLDTTHSTAEESQRLLRAFKTNRLKRVDSSILLHTKTDDNDAAKTASYLQQLITHIVDNLELKLTNIHIRYEDSYSDPEKVFSFGISLEEVTLTTTDNTWTAKFVKRENDTGGYSSVHKLGLIQNCGIYWNVNTRCVSGMSNQDWEEYMYATIYRGEMTTTKIDQFSYILGPPNNLIIKLIHSNICDETKPNVDVTIETSVVAFEFDSIQFKQLMMLIKSFAELNRKCLMSTYRPVNRPNVDPKSWWFYAYRLITGQDFSASSKVINFSFFSSVFFINPHFLLLD